MIKEYHFGSITINGKTYSYDVELYWDDQVLRWQRTESHRVDIDSVRRAIEQNPDLIVIGTGESGIAEVLEETKEEIISAGIGLVVEKTGQAVRTFNEKKEKKVKVIGLFHLTC